MEIKIKSEPDGRMMEAFFNGSLIAKSDKTIVVEKNHYFPPSAIKKEFFKKSDEKSICPWKGEAAYYDVVVDGKTGEGSAWYYPEPKSIAEPIKNYVAFWRGVEVKEAEQGE